MKTQAEVYILLMVRKSSSGNLEIMKKRYEMPTIDLVELETEPMMNVASTETGGAGVGNEPVGGNTPDLSSSNRGTWGDLWK